MGVDDNNNASGATIAAALGGVVPGFSGGEGCSAAGGCATCPFMKMNDVVMLHDVINMIGRVHLLSASWLSSGGGGSEGRASLKDELRLSGHLSPSQLQRMHIGGRDAVKPRTEPIVYMRELMRDGRLSNKLVKRVEWAAGRMATY
jgi:quinolinate synthase